MSTNTLLGILYRIKITYVINTARSYYYFSFRSIYYRPKKCINYMDLLNIFTNCNYLTLFCFVYLYNRLVKY